MVIQGLYVPYVTYVTYNPRAPPHSDSDGPRTASVYRVDILKRAGHVRGRAQATWGIGAHVRDRMQSMMACVGVHPWSPPTQAN